MKLLSREEPIHRVDVLEKASNASVAELSSGEIDLEWCAF
jgi:hypothetical protein